MLPKLEIIEQFTGFGGKHVLTLQGANTVDAPLPENKFTPGSSLGEYVRIALFIHYVWL